MTNILIISEKYWPDGGGAEHATHLVLELLKNTGNFNMTVLTGTKEPKRIDGVDYIYSQALDTSTKIQLWKNLIISNKFGCFDNLVKRSDIVYIPRLGYPLIPLAKRYKKKVVVHLHDFQPITYCAGIFANAKSEQHWKLLEDMRRSAEFEIYENKSILRAFLSSLVTPVNKINEPWINLSDNIICVSKKQNGIIQTYQPELKDKLKTIYNPLPNIPNIKKNLQTPTMLYLGGGRYFKGFYTLLNTFPKILSRGYDIRFLLINGFDDSTKLMFKKLNIEHGGKFIVQGHIDYKKMLSLYEVSYALLFTSILEEPLSYTVLESMLAGTLPIVSGVGGVFELVRGTLAESMIFKPNNSEQLLERIEYVLSLSREQILNLGIGLRESVIDRFNNYTIQQQLLKIFA